MRSTDVIDWAQYPNFNEQEFRCRHTGLCYMDARFMTRLQAIRNAYGKPMIITSGYRAKTHPVEARKAAPGEHTLGLAADISVRGSDAFNLLKIALAHGIMRIGVKQTGEGRFLHLGMATSNFPSPMIWSY
ncbi:D-Ala-D-Ala carboxypeptidase family metallohydrolase [Nitrosomonas sp. HPC101]|uniref:D-Ala-D-Ala carboxypeptidase family metallohydrolase n=1 Tax=Nitrosomonas sp. HPC101 TaxID=1658667 RepID=UPI0013DDEB6C